MCGRTTTAAPKIKVTWDGDHLHFRLREESHDFPFTEDLDFHILELPKFTKTPAELASGLDTWLYFLRHAEKIDTEAVPAALQQPLVLRALEELKVISQTDLERERYEARRKAQLDYDTGLKLARTEGREEGEKVGMIRLVQLCERLLDRPQTPREELICLSLDDLSRLADELQAHLRSNGKG